MKKKFLIISDDIEVRKLITLVINENTSGFPINKIDVSSVYDLISKQQPKEHYDFIFFDIRFLNYSACSIFDILNNLFLSAYFITINNEQTEDICKKKKANLGCITIKENFVFENIVSRFNTLLEIGLRNQRFLSGTNRLLNICNNIETLYELMPNDQELNLNQQL